MAKGRQFPVREGSPFPRGATWDGKGTNFALFSAHATKVEVCLFDGAGDTEIARIALPEYTDQIFHGYLPEVGPGHLLRLSRPRSLRAGHRPSLQSQQAAARPLCRAPMPASSSGIPRSSATRWRPRTI